VQRTIGRLTQVLRAPSIVATGSDEYFDLTVLDRGSAVLHDDDRLAAVDDRMHLPLVLRLLLTLYRHR
jgi:hypothetical protein